MGARFFIRMPYCPSEISTSFRLRNASTLHFRMREGVHMFLYSGSLALICWKLGGQLLRGDPEEDRGLDKIAGVDLGFQAFFQGLAQGHVFAQVFRHEAHRRGVGLEHPERRLRILIVLGLALWASGSGIT